MRRASTASCSNSASTSGETSVSKYMVRSRKPPSQTWRAYLENHVQLVSIDFFTLPRLVSKSFTCSWYWPMTVVAYFISM